MEFETHVSSFFAVRASHIVEAAPMVKVAMPTSGNRQSSLAPERIKLMVAPPVQKRQKPNQTDMNVRY